MRLPAERNRKLDVHILELGCGTGELAFELAKIAGARVTGVDRSQKFIDYASCQLSSPQSSLPRRKFQRLLARSCSGKI